MRRLARFGLGVSCALPPARAADDAPHKIFPPRGRIRDHLLVPRQAEANAHDDDLVNALAGRPGDGGQARAGAGRALGFARQGSISRRAARRARGGGGEMGLGEGKNKEKKKASSSPGE